ncbi:TnpV protein [Mediterraneibacter gnavus]|uniref:TnpV protein n=1 Tax=Mediterraneibacter gnavus TaxID=33038 RepID=UPI003F5FF56F
MYIGVSKMTNINKERIIEQMKQEQGITEQLKAENQMEWVSRMNNIQACAREVVNAELIYN